jgi:hypothetical protein
MGHNILYLVPSVQNETLLAGINTRLFDDFIEGMDLKLQELSTDRLK